MAEAYLLQFERLVAEAYETTRAAKDSVSALVPFAVVTLTKTDSTTQRVRFWPVSSKKTPTAVPLVIRGASDINDGESFLLTRHHVFGPLFRDYPSFFSKGDTRMRN